jgi:hypothetical protein
MEQLTTKKLFYGKWPYKIECHVTGSTNITRMGVAGVKSWCNGRLAVLSSSNGVNKSILLAFVKKIEKFYDKDLQFRAETNRFNIFCRDKVLLDKMINDLQAWVYCVTVPANDQEYEFLLENGHKKVICDDIPFKKYQYKMYIKESMLLDQREKFFNWISKYPDTIRVANATKKWLQGGRNWIQDPFIYVSDQKMMSMLLLYLGDHTKRINEFIPRSSINT